MQVFFISLVTVMLSMLVLDAAWLMLTAKSFYAKYIGSLLAESPSLVPAGFFYVIYAVGVTIFVVFPALSGHSPLLKVFLLGAIFGCVAYATYDLTNQATLKEWATIVTVVDLVWGSLLTGTLSVLATTVVRYFS